MTKKFKFDKTGTMNNVVGAVGGGAVNAVYDRYLASYLQFGKEGEEKPYGHYVKAVIGAAVPFFIENRMVQTGANVLLGCAVSDMLKTTDTFKVSGLSHVSGSSHVGNTRRNWSIPLSAESRQALRPSGSGGGNRQKLYTSS